MHGNIWEYSSRYEVVRFRFALGCAMMDLCEPDNPNHSFIAVQPRCEFLLWQEIDMAHLLWWQVEEFPMNDKRIILGGGGGDLFWHIRNLSCPFFVIIYFWLHMICIVIVAVE